MTDHSSMNNQTYFRLFGRSVDFLTIHRPA
nr:MAG TPA: LIN37 [Caudoviricetes sp.]